MDQKNISVLFKINFLKIFAGLLIFMAFTLILMPFYLPITLGGILAMAFSPLVKYLLKAGLGRIWSLVLLSLFLFLSLATPLTLLLIKGSKLMGQFLSAGTFLTARNNFEKHFLDFMKHFSAFNKIDPIIVKDKMNSSLSSLGDTILKIITDFIGKLPDVFLWSFITILAFYLFLLKEQAIRLWFDRYFYFPKDKGDRFIHLMKSCCREVFVSNVVTGIIQATILASGAYFCEVGEFTMIFFTTFFLSFIPMIGAGPFGAFLSLLIFLEDRPGAGIAMGVVAIVSGVIDNIIRPYLSSYGTVEVPWIINFFAIIGGVFTMGLPGLFVGPLIASLTFGLLPIILEEYFPKSFKGSGDY